MRVRTTSGTQDLYTLFQRDTSKIETHRNTHPEQPRACERPRKKPKASLATTGHYCGSHGGWSVERVDAFFSLHLLLLSSSPPPLPPSPHNTTTTTTKEELTVRLPRRTHLNGPSHTGISRKNQTNSWGFLDSTPKTNSKTCSHLAQERWTTTVEEKFQPEVFSSYGPMRRQLSHWTGLKCHFQKGAQLLIQGKALEKECDQLVKDTEEMVSWRSTSQGEIDELWKNCCNF